PSPRLARDVRRAEACDGLADHALDVALDADVADDGERLAPRLRDQPRRLRGRVAVHVGDGDARPRLREEERPLAALSPPGPGDEGDLAVETHPGSLAEHVAPVMRRAETRSRSA